MFAEDIVAKFGWRSKPQEVRPHEPRPWARTSVAQSIAQFLLSFEDASHGRRLRRLQDIERKEADHYREIGEIAVMSLELDREQTAVMAATDVFIQGNYGGDVMTIFDCAKQTQRRYLHQTQSAINAYRQTLRLVTPDPHYEDQLCRLMDDLTREAK